ncbi:MAG: tetratricopeptide repeat protein, partial [Actinobacteria bacterium]|nr:tetratricopeptide repeat protein [Actinomycetota bacterium]
MGRWDLAERELRGVLELDPADARALAALAFCRGRAGDPFAALELCNEALALAPDDPYVHRIRAYVGTGGSTADDAAAAGEAGAQSTTAGLINGTNVNINEVAPSVSPITAITGGSSSTITLNVPRTVLNWNTNAANGAVGF